MKGKEEDREQSSHQVDRQESRKAGGETLAKGWRLVWEQGGGQDRVGSII